MTDKPVCPGAWFASGKVSWRLDYDRILSYIGPALPIAASAVDSAPFSEMSSMNHDARLFGLDLAPLARLTHEAWADFLHWPLVRWLVPRAPVLLQDGGRWWLVRAGTPPGRALSLTDAAARKLGGRHSLAWLVDEEHLLRWQMPAVPGANVTKMVELDVVGRSPFTAEGTVWAFEPAPKTGGTIHLVAAARATVVQGAATWAAHWGAVKGGATAGTSGGVASAEAWVRGIDGHRYWPLAGVNDERRLQRDRWSAAGLGALLLCLLISASALLLTPSVRLYMELSQARAAWLDLSQRAAGTLEARQTHAHLIERAAQLDVIAANASDPVGALRIITDALPDDAYLRGLQVVGGKVTISGETNGTTAALMSRLDQVPGIKEVRAPQPATKPLGAQREQFVIELQLTPADTSSSPSADAPPKGDRPS